MTTQLEQEQEDLLSMLVEAHRNVLREQRKPFSIQQFDELFDFELSHKGLPNGKINAYPGDIKTLARERLISVNNGYNEVSDDFDITPQGFAYYKQMKLRDSQPLQRIDTSLRKYLESDLFQQKYSKAYLKWKGAEALLWDSDSERQLTTIGHLCREAIQEFATSLVESYQPPNVDTNKAHDIARIKAVINFRVSELGEREKVFLAALISYWCSVSGLVQRQEHGTQKQGHSLIWEDGRRVVFQTAIVMYEVDSSLSKSH